MNREEIIESLKSMIKSCFTYGGAERNSFNFKQYILPYKEKLGNEPFEKVYVEYLKYLKENFEITYNVYTDSEGGFYNSLKRKNNFN